MRRPLVIAHRGDARRAAENSALAIRAAADAGADWVEVDVRPTREGELVLAHDQMLGGVDVLSSTLGQLRQAHDQVATLDEAFEGAAGLSGINLELKPPIPVTESFLSRLKTSCGAWSGELLLSSFFIPLIEQVRTTWPDVETGILSGASYDPDGRIALDAAASLNCGTILPEDSSITKHLVEEAHKAGARIIAWTVNDPDRVRTLAEWGVDGIITDDIASARAVVGSI